VSQKNVERGSSPLGRLESWLDAAEAAGVAQPRAVAFVTVGQDGRPTARTVLVKRVEEDALVFSSALWTRKVSEIASNPHVALLFYWPTLGRQVHVVGTAAVAERELAEGLFAERELSHQVQTLVSRQGEPIESIDALRTRHAHLLGALETPPECPEDWGAIRVCPDVIEFWEEAPDRIHDRILYERDANAWRVTRLAP
jgi:pyridoxamine 5'-phosphate oxidase